MSSTAWSGATTAWGTRVLLWEHTDIGGYNARCWMLLWEHTDIGGYNARCWLDADSDTRAIVAFVEANTALDGITAFARWGSR